MNRNLSRAKKTGMVMPVRYAEMTEEEMEYDGGFFNWGFSAIVSVVGWTASFVGHAVDNDTLKNIGTTLTFVGMVSGLGTVIKGVQLMSAGLSTSKTTADVVYGLTIGVADGTFGAGSIIGGSKFFNAILNKRV